MLTKPKYKWWLLKIKFNDRNQLDDKISLGLGGGFSISTFKVCQLIYYPSILPKSYFLYWEYKLNLVFYAKLGKKYFFILMKVLKMSI